MGESSFCGFAIGHSFQGLHAMERFIFLSPRRILQLVLFLIEIKNRDFMSYSFTALPSFGISIINEHFYPNS